MCQVQCPGHCWRLGGLRRGSRAAAVTAVEDREQRASLHAARLDQLVRPSVDLREVGHGLRVAAAGLRVALLILRAELAEAAVEAQKQFARELAEGLLGRLVHGSIVPRAQVTDRYRCDF